ncbi:hypothetical protein [Azospirillum cavernae]|uniref:hypothetical protein n=1 Tax=Azospirillum cavernae TaxID=2320860 RepID=UPI0011C38CC7|nr:hypothetical protein [Azospirillum cavernae]
MTKRSGGRRRLTKRGGGRRRLTKPSGGGRGLTKRSGGGRGLTKPSGGRRGLTKPSGGGRRLTKRSGGGRRLTKRSGGGRGGLRRRLTLKLDLRGGHATLIACAAKQARSGGSNVGSRHAIKAALLKQFTLVCQTVQPIPKFEIRRHPLYKLQRSENHIINSWSFDFHREMRNAIQKHPTIPSFLQ